MSFFTGFSATFLTGIFGTAIHFTKAFGLERNFLLGLSGVVLGVGEITGEPPIWQFKYD
jgi:hypothetical protein